VPAFELLFGKAVCLVDLIDCLPTTGICCTHPEAFFGDFSVGRYQWITARRRPLKPFPVAGRQGLFRVPQEIIERIELEAA